MSSYYDENATLFAKESFAADLTAVYVPFLALVPPGGMILDAGCGPGRDTKAFLQRGYSVDAFDQSSEMVRLAQEYTGIKVTNISFQDLRAEQRYDGIWCCASLLHVPKASEKQVFSRISRALKPGGAWYMSYKLGSGERRDGGRQFNDHTAETLEEALRAIPGIKVVRHWLTNDARPERGEQRWLNLLATRSGNS